MTHTTGVGPDPATAAILHAAPTARLLFDRAHLLATIAIRQMTHHLAATGMCPEEISLIIGSSLRETERYLRTPVPHAPEARGRRVAAFDAAITDMIWGSDSSLWAQTLAAGTEGAPA